MQDLKFHEFAERFPLLEGDEYEALKQSIQECGGNTYKIIYRQRPDTNTAEGIDGRNRLRACRELGLDPQFQLIEIAEDQIVPRIIALNVARRHLTRETRQQIAVELRGRGYSTTRIAEMLGCSQPTVWRDLNTNDDSGYSNEYPDVVVGKDGKEYPAAQAEQDSAQSESGATFVTPDMGDACEEPPNPPNSPIVPPSSTPADSDPGDATPEPPVAPCNPVPAAPKPVPPLDAKPPAVLCAECKKLGWVKGCPNCVRATERKTFVETFSAAERSAERMGRLNDKAKDVFSAIFNWVLELGESRVPELKK